MSAVAKPRPVGKLDELAKLMYLAACKSGKHPQALCDKMEGDAEKFRQDLKAVKDAGVVKGSRMVASGAKKNLTGAYDATKWGAGHVWKKISTEPSYFLSFYGLLLCALAAILFYVNLWDVSTSFPVLSIVGVLVPAFMVFMGYTKLTTDKKAAAHPGPEQQTSVYTHMFSALLFIGAFVFVMLVVVFVLALIGSFKYGMDIFSVLSYIALAIGAGAGLLALNSKLKKAIDSPDPSWLKLVGLLLFYIPCLFLDLIQYLKEQYSITAAPIWIILAYELAIIAAYVLIPKLLDYIITAEGSVLLRDPVYLSKPQSLGDLKTLYNPTESGGELDMETAQNYKYSISFWFRINPQPPNMRLSSSRDTNILEFGDRPRVTYNNSNQLFKVTCKMRPGRVRTIFKQTGVPLQKWNNLVINCDGANMTVFLNGTLVASAPNISPYTAYDLITIGEAEGLEGGITNVQYRKRVLGEGEISIGYKGSALLTTTIT